MQRSTPPLHFVRALLAAIARRRAPLQPVEAAMAELRRAMLAATARAPADRIPAITRRIYGAEDLADLWFLRTDLMVALASSLGEAPARVALASISERFIGLLPKCLLSRPSPLAT